jgi:hypothetical protein
MGRRTRRRCPFCDSKRIRRERRYGFPEKFLFPILNGYPYFCGDCRSRFILFIGPVVPSAHEKARQKKLVQDNNEFRQGK